MWYGVTTYVVTKVDQIHTIAREVCLKDKYSLPEKLTVSL